MDKNKKIRSDTMKKFTYYCRLRPPTPGAIPKDGIVEVVDKKL